MEILSAPQLKRLQGSDVLVVDDSAAIRSVLVALLQRLGIAHIREAENGLSAMALMQQRAADIVLCDLNMPGMDGVELLRTLASASPGIAVLPISSLDARLRFAVSRMAGELGLHVLGVLAKPFKEEDLLRALADFGQAPAVRKTTATAFSADDLADALDANRIEIHYQPQVRMIDAELVGFEALVRLRDRDGELVSPDAFIAMSESNGDIHRLTHQIIERSLKQLSLWSRQGRDFALSVNLSAASMTQLDLPEHIEAIAQSYGLSADRINIELTETQVQVGAELYDVMTRFRMRGFGLSIDDFGTGDSSLTRLRSMPFTELKIDQEFVRGCTRSQEQQSIVNSSIELGHQLGMLIVAEGVQSPEEWDVLGAVGCDIAQGYLISPPLPPGDVPAWANSWKRLNAESIMSRAGQESH